MIRRFFSWVRRRMARAAKAEEIMNHPRGPEYALEQYAKKPIV